MDLSRSQTKYSQASKNEIKSTKQPITSENNKDRPGRDTQQAQYGAPSVPGVPDLSCYLETPCTRSCGEGFKLLLPNPDITNGCYGAAMHVDFFYA